MATPRLFSSHTSRLLHTATLRPFQCCSQPAPAAASRLRFHSDTSPILNASRKTFASSVRQQHQQGNSILSTLGLSNASARSRSSLPFFRTSRRSQSSSTIASTQPDATTSDNSQSLPRLTSPAVSVHLFTIAGLVFAIVVVGGLTRLTESGLSITEWNLVTGTLPPLNHEQWMSEYNKYMVTPEGTLMNKGMSLEEFKRIYRWEWGHRFLGRVIGLAFLAPIPYFMYKKRLSKKTGAMLFGIATLIGGQGALGWYMVKSGLTHEAIQARDGVPRVSQYRLAAHLGMAFLVYALALRHAIGIRRDWSIAKLGKAIGGSGASAKESLRFLATPQAKKVRVLVTGLTGLVFLTAISGAFVAGLDAGLLYNTFPYMGETIVPPISELYSPRYSRSSDQSDLYIRNSLENPTTVQFDHRALATTTFTAIVALFLYVRRPAVAMHLPKNTLRAVKSVVHMAILQVALGISTLVYLVPIPLAAAHQAGSLVLLSLCIAAGATLRRPSQNARRYIEMMSRMTSRPAPHIRPANATQSAKAASQASGPAFEIPADRFPITTA